MSYKLFQVLLGIRYLQCDLIYMLKTNNMQTQYLFAHLQGIDKQRDTRVCKRLKVD